MNCHSKLPIDTQTILFKLLSFQVSVMIQMACKDETLDCKGMSEAFTQHTILLAAGIITSIFSSA